MVRLSLAIAAAASFGLWWLPTAASLYGALSSLPF